MLFCSIVLCLISNCFVYLQCGIGRDLPILHIKTLECHIQNNNMKHNSLRKGLILLATCTLSFGQVFAGATDYYMGKGRIALSSDGNMHDNDDMHATKMTLMILAKAGLQNQTTLYTYADHVWGSEKNDLEIMRASAEVTGEKFGFTNCRFMAAVENPNAAYKAMATEIAKSTAEDPLFIIAAGPMEVVGRGFEMANQITPEALNHVTIISHSIWNDQHADNPEQNSVHGTEPSHSGWTWKEMEKAFGDRVNFNHISDQNASGTGQEVYRNKDKFSAPSWNSWEWMKTHKDPNIQWVRNNKGIQCGADYSDAGIAYYMVADLDGQRGDEFGNPEKLQRWIGSEPIPVKINKNHVTNIALNNTCFILKTVGDSKQITATVTPSTAAQSGLVWSSSRPCVAAVNGNGRVEAKGYGATTITAFAPSGNKVAECYVTVGHTKAGDVTVGTDFIAIEAEASTTPLSKNWAVRRAGNNNFDQITGQTPAVNGSYIEYMSGKTNGLGIKAGSDVLTYQFIPKTSGTYYFSGRMAQQMNQPSGIAPWDQCNDVFIKMEGDFTSGNETPMNILANWTKFYGRGFNAWGSFVQADVNHAKYKLAYNLKAGEVYTLCISARSRGVCIDYFLFSMQPLHAEEKIDLATINPVRLRPDGCKK